MKASNPETENRKSKILLVDDNEQNLNMLQILLKGHGYEVVLAAHGTEALETAQRDPPDMIIADILMPVMDGFTLCREWKKDEALQAIPFVFYTATYIDPKDEEFALSLGAERFIVKPVEPDVFVELLREVIEEHKAGRLVAPREPVEEEAVYFREYNEALIRKLEDKMLQLEGANRRLLALQDACAAMTSSLGLDEVLRRIGRGAVEALSSSAVWILAVNQAEKTLESKVMASAGEEDVAAVENALGMKADAVRIPIVAGRNWLTDAVLSGEPIFVPHVSEIRQRARRPEMLIKLGKITTFKSLAVVPLLVKDRAVGVMALARPSSGEVPEAEMRLITAFTRHAAIAIENARLYEQARQHAEELERRVDERTAELRRLVSAMVGREVRMAELKDVIRQLRAQLEEAGLTPMADDPLFRNDE